MLRNFIGYTATDFLFPDSLRDINIIFGAESHLGAVGLDLKGNAGDNRLEFSIRGGKGKKGVGITLGFERIPELGKSKWGKEATLGFERIPEVCDE